MENIDQELRKQRRETIFNMWLACYTQQEIADEVGVSQTEVDRETKELPNLANLPKRVKLHALYQEADWAVVDLTRMGRQVIISTVSGRIGFLFTICPAAPKPIFPETEGLTRCGRAFR